MIRLLIADASDALRIGLRMIFSLDPQHITIVAEESRANEVLHSAQLYCPDCDHYWRRFGGCAIRHPAYFEAAGVIGTCCADDEHRSTHQAANVRQRCIHLYWEARIPSRVAEFCACYYAQALGRTLCSLATRPMSLERFIAIHFFWIQQACYPIRQ